jgi:hypothetical protein
MKEFKKMVAIWRILFGKYAPWFFYPGWSIKTIIENLDRKSKFVKMPN